VRHLVDGRASLAEAIEAPRFHHGFVPDVGRYEPPLAAFPELLRGLQSRGHKLKAFGRRIGDANCILMDGSRAVGYADSREPGIAIGVETR
jgi:gamma-glutamyltranspeptidase